MDESAHAARSSSATMVGIGAVALWSFSGACYAMGGRALGDKPYLCITSAVGVATIVILQLIRRRSVIKLFHLPLRVMAAGIIGIVVYSLLLAWAMAHAAEADLAQVMLLNYLWPIWTVLLSLLLVKEKHRASPAIAGAILGFAGVVLAQNKAVFGYRAAALTPHAMAAAAGVLWALYTVLLRRWKIPSEQGGSTFQFMVLAVVAGLLGVHHGDWGVLSAPPAVGLTVAFLAGIGPVGLGYYWWEIGIKRGNLHTLAVLSYFIPIVSSVMIGTLYHKSQGPLLLPGAALIAVGAWVGRARDHSGD